MKKSDLLPKNVDEHPVRIRGFGVVILDHRPGHIFDCVGETTIIGIEAKDSQGNPWRILEDTEGVYKVKRDG